LAPQTAFPDLAKLPDGLTGTDRGHLFFCLADGDLLGTVRFRGAIARVVHFEVTEHPTQEWTLQQMREAFP